MAAPLTYNASLVERVDITDTLATFAIAPDQPPAAPWFVPGQYCLLGVNGDGGSVRRPMTFASAPERTGPPEFYIKWIAEPTSALALTHGLWRLAPGERLYLRAHATGKFTLRDTVGDRDLALVVMVAAGTGVAPFMSMVRSAAERGDELGRFALLYGVSRPADLAYHDELQALAQDRGLRYLPTVSRPAEAPGWGGDRGRVEDYFAAERLADTERRLGLRPGELTPAVAAILVCGLQGTIRECIARTLCRGFIPDHRRMRRAFGAPDGAPASLFFEQYDTARVFDTKDEQAVAPLRAALQSALG